MYLFFLFPQLNCGRLRTTSLRDVKWTLFSFTLCAHGNRKRLHRSLSGSGWCVGASNPKQKLNKSWHFCWLNRNLLGCVRWDSSNAMRIVIDLDVGLTYAIAYGMMMFSGHPEFIRIVELNMSIADTQIYFRFRSGGTSVSAQADNWQQNCHLIWHCTLLLLLSKGQWSDAMVKVLLYNSPRSMWLYELVAHRTRTITQNYVISPHATATPSYTNFCHSHDFQL